MSMKMKIYVACITCLVILVSVGLTTRLSSGGKITSKSRSKADTVFVETDIALIAPIREVLHFNGTLESNNQVNVLSQATGTILRVDATVGMSCKKGQVLVVLDNDMQKLALEQAEAQVLVAETNYQKLQNDNNNRTETDSSLSAGDLETMSLTLKAAQAQCKAAVANRKMLQKQLEDTYIKAGLTGVVASCNVNVGQTIVPGTEIAVIIDETHLKLKISVSEHDILKVKSGQMSSIAIDALSDTSFAGIVKTVSLLPDTATKKYPMEVWISNSGPKKLKPGMFCRCEILTQSKDTALTVSEQAVVLEPSGSASVFMLQNAKAKRLPVLVGIKDEGRYEIVAGLAEGIKVATTGKEKITDGVVVFEKFRSVYENN